MASALSIAIAKQDAITRIDAHLSRLSEEKGAQYTALPSTGRDALVLSKDQLVLIADALDTVFGKAEQVVEVVTADRDTEDAHGDKPTRKKGK
jgi:hypothetical protein